MTTETEIIFADKKHEREFKRVLGQTSEIAIERVGNAYKQTFTPFDLFKTEQKLKETLSDCHTAHTVIKHLAVNKEATISIVAGE